MTSTLAFGIAAAVLAVALPIAFVVLRRRRLIMNFHEQE